MRGRNSIFTTVLERETVEERGEGEGEEDILATALKTDKHTES